MSELDYSYLAALLGEELEWEHPNLTALQPFVPSAVVEERIWSSDLLVVEELPNGCYDLNLKEEFKCPGCHDKNLWSVLDELGWPDGKSYVAHHTDCDPARDPFIFDEKDF